MHPPPWLYLLLQIMPMAVADEATEHKVLASPRGKKKSRCEMEGNICLNKEYICDLIGGTKVGHSCDDKDYICCTGDAIQSQDTTCKWSMKTSCENLPLVVEESAKRIILPEGENREIRFENGEIFWIACNNEGFSLESLNKEVYKLICLRGKFYQKLQDEIRSFNYDFNKLGCKKPVKSSVEMTNQDCGNVNDNVDGPDRGLTHEIGFKFGNKFSPLIKVCFGEKFQTTLWTEHKLFGKNLPARRAYGKTRSFRKGDFFNDIKMKETYEGKGQKENLKFLNKIRGDFIDSYRNYLQRGHLSPIGDFITTAEMDATNLFTNVLPQWQEINTGNWGILEDEIRIYAEQKNENVKIISGGYGIMTMDVNGKIENLFLTKKKVDGKNKYFVPVPKYLWKIVIVKKNSDKRVAVAFVVINDPYITMKPDETQLLCKDICDELVWLKGFNSYLRHELSYGYTYCCEVKDLKTKIPTIPEKVYDVDISNLDLFKE